VWRALAQATAGLGIGAGWIAEHVDP